MEILEANVGHQEAIAQLLKSTFALPPAQVSPEFLQWKFFSPRSGSTRSRSYLLCENGEILAHVCEWPISFLSSAGEVAACHFIDWLAVPRWRGAGCSLMRPLLKQHGIVLAIGGSPKARPLLPRLGFQPFGTLDQFAMVARPWRQHCSRSDNKGARALARLARNAAWSMHSRLLAESKWTATPVTGAMEVPASALRLRAASFCMTTRTAEELQYFADCPLMNCRTYVLRKGGAQRGYFVLNQVAGQCRIIDLAVDSEAPADWEGAYRAAAIAARAWKQTCEIVAVSSLPWLSQALSRIGFKLRKQSPVCLFDPAGKILGGPPLHLRLTDNDECFLYEEGNLFST